MPTSVYFNNFGASQEQLLIENLIVESIRIYGHDVFYLPRVIEARNEIFGEDASSKYERNYMVEMYIKNVDGFEGDGSFFSKFNIEIRDQVTFTVSRRAFAEEVQTAEAQPRPNEGDLIYFPLNQKVFQVKYVNNNAIFYQLGALQVWDLVCEVYEYSGETLNTGIPEIDRIQIDYSPATTGSGFITEEYNFYYLTDEDGFKFVNESFDLENTEFVSDNAELELEGDDIIDFSEIDPFSEGKI
jgi:hypothetical protein